MKWATSIHEQKAKKLSLATWLLHVLAQMQMYDFGDDIPAVLFREIGKSIPRRSGKSSLHLPNSIPIIHIIIIIIIIIINIIIIKNLNI